jgi:hypothetical protein
MRSESLAKVFVVATGNQQYRAVYARMVAKQDGLCSYCGIAISQSDTIVSKAYVRKSKYFHKACAEKINII